MLHRYLEHFKAVAETSSMLKAAEILNLSQPSLSRSIKILEDTIDTKLFERKNKGVQLTEYGMILYHQVCSMGTEFHYALEEIEHIKYKTIKTLKIGSGLAWQYGVFPNIIQKYRDAYPQVKVSVITGVSRILYNALLESKYDIVFCNIAMIKPMEGIVQEHLLNVCFTFYARKDHPIFSKKHNREQDLGEYAVAVFSHGNQITLEDEDDNMLLSEINRCRIKYVSGSMINLLEVISSSMYLTLLPLQINFIAEKFGLKEIHADLRRSPFPSGMVYHKNIFKKDHIRFFLESVRENIE